MQPDTADYEPHYLAGIVLFNQGDFFEAHEVWEDAWIHTSGELKKFYQGLIQAAVGLCHFCNGNLNGALKLYHSSRDKMRDVPSIYQGLNLPEFLAAMEQCFHELLTRDPAAPPPQVREELLPVIAVTPPPEQWPNPQDFMEHEES
jgi:uncharacterized protein